MSDRAVVTGANSGIGLATTLKLARDGFEVYAGARRAEGLEDIARSAAEAGVDGVVPISLDVTDDASVAAAFAQVHEGGAVTVLVNNAGITGSGSIEETPIATYQAMFDTNVLGTVRCTQQVLAPMREACAGRIINISSSSAISGPPLMGPYASTKVAVEGLSESLQAEVAPFGIRVVAIQAGTILTPIWGKADAPAADTAYPVARDFLLAVLTHQLATSGVPAETVAEAIAAAIAADAPPLRQVVGDASVLADLHAEHPEEAVEVFFREGEDFRQRYREISGVDYWA